ncbi:MAG: HPF/RaiA family ribosome-associated protein [Myxococcota bacterium]|nr:HPF/RaiA family ribosome-associated protein [Myxococcota bacterium]
MLIQLNTDDHIAGTEQLASEVTSTVEGRLGRFEDRITRVEVHLHDVNAARGGKDQRCLLEVRLAGRRPIAVSHLAPTVEEAVEGASHKALSAIESMLGRLESHHP